MSLPEHVTSKVAGLSRNEQLIKSLPDRVVRGATIVGDATIVLTEYLERWHGVTLDTEARARLLTGLIPLLLPEIQRDSRSDGSS